ncbi:MAG: filamentous hemagglutinin N-terminal domain-containing protein, partial [Campylobacteraceae bacterium]|nr:filamentous hemagglutinin N-terminal domain-containing protein [Campylobacteraceae bacterium]
MKLQILKQATSIYISLFLVLSPTLTQAKNLTPDGSTNTKIDKSRTGIPIVNIANPSSLGLSHNKFKDYNVNSNGLILNNSMNEIQKLKSGEYIQGNKHLHSHAKVILNEITSTNKTYLNGATEIAGKKADLIIANPNGMSINGASFLNTSNLTLTTGKVNVSKGILNSFSVSKGDISIEGDGLNTLNQDSTYIYSQSLKVNATINAKNLEIKLGNNEIDASNKIRSSSNANVNLLLDSSSLGGMYANRISLVGTSKGLGVNLPPEVKASLGGITISTDGNISLDELSAPEDIKIISQSEGIYSKGKIHSNKNVSLNSKEYIVNDGSITSQNN